MNHVHQALFTSVVIYYAVLTLWGAFMYVRGSEPSGSYLGAAILGEALVVVQAATGLLLLASGHHPKTEALHFLYGAVILLAVPFVYLTVGQRRDRNASGFFALACLLIVIIALFRAKATG
ncbi:MAG TPA: hypothetical protein VFB34_08895 [Chloroflexota bacterium]|nr:hypothetical protein [Chloroflexota bacterium]